MRKIVENIDRNIDTQVCQRTQYFANDIYLLSSSSTNWFSPIYQQYTFEHNKRQRRIKYFW
jgi:hypothetical protein